MISRFMPRHQQVRDHAGSALQVLHAMPVPADSIAEACR